MLVASAVGDASTKAPPLRKRLHIGEKEIAAAAPDAQGNKTMTVSATR